MKKYWLGTVALVALGTAASAADLPARYSKAPVMVDPAYNWTGFYVGLNAGAASTEGNTNIRSLDPSTLLTRNFFTDNFNSTRFIGGGQIGYNYQSGMSVFGVEADADWMRMRSSTGALFDPFFGGKGNSIAAFRSSIDWLVTVRGRAGIAATPALLLYVTGGLAVAEVKVSYQNSGIFFFNGAPFGGTLSVSDTRYGWTAGFGAEYAFGGNWSIKGEYLRVRLEDTTLNIAAGPVTTFPGSVRVHDSIDLIRAGINYRFGGPIVARY